MHTKHQLVLEVGQSLRPAKGKQKQESVLWQSQLEVLLLLLKLV